MRILLKIDAGSEMRISTEIPKCQIPAPATKICSITVNGSSQNSAVWFAFSANGTRTPNAIPIKNKTRILSMKSNEIEWIYWLLNSSEIFISQIYY